jgi:putative selenate reductase
MSDRMIPIPYEEMIQWIFSEYHAEKSIFGLSSDKFYNKMNENNLSLFGYSLESPLGPAAGPHTQLAQNIVTAYLAGSRFIELKTVQKLDGEDLPVSKPCIFARDEGYNVEWSTELTVEAAFEEYVKAWFLIKILSEELSLGSTCGFVFNMSVGYDLDGIKTPKLDAFIEGLKDASKTEIYKQCKQSTLKHIHRLAKVDKDFIETISPNICNSITLSTLHGCPPEEIERIASYLLEEKKLNTYIKCNPTLLGYDFTRDLLNQLGYEYLSFDDHHFRNDLQFDDAVPLIARMQKLSKEVGLDFGVKLSNTFPVRITDNTLPGDEMYMSGRALFPLTIHLAFKLASAFQGNLRISWSGGADSHNVYKIFETGIWPITLATSLLKPGGYARLLQLTDSLDRMNKSGEFQGIDRLKLKKLADSSRTDSCYQKDSREVQNRKINKTLPLLDCYIAPCKEGCPIGQDIPEYIRLVGEKRFREAFETIVAKNPLPFITGTICNHECETKCTRLDYEEAVDIRGCKLVAAEAAFKEYIESIEQAEVSSDVKVAVIGAGPAGLSAAYFLCKQGIETTVFDCREKIGGIIEHVAPEFRISKEAIRSDMELIRKAGVKFRLGVNAAFSVEELKSEGFTYVFIAIGAEKPTLLPLDSCDKPPLNVLEFLQIYNQCGKSLIVGKNVAVIGAGNSAMDAARSAKRLSGVDSVSIIYRRTKKEMPADPEELQLALDEGVQFLELLSPVSFVNNMLKCQKMKLGSPDASGRRTTIPIPDQFDTFLMDSLISAVGEHVDSDILQKNGISLSKNGYAVVDPETLETSCENVFIGGDARMGPATIVKGIADGTRFAQTVLKRENKGKLDLDSITGFDALKRQKEIQDKKAVMKRKFAPDSEHVRCLECNTLCNICVEVCPNRANICIRRLDDSLSSGTKQNQVIHIEGLCNECGNCEVFCPYQSAPYKDKFTLYWSVEEFERCHHAGFVAIDFQRGLFKVRLGDKVSDLEFHPLGTWESDIPKEFGDLIQKVFLEYSYLFSQRGG